jgi:hypothetical protein
VQQLKANKLKRNQNVVSSYETASISQVTFGETAPGLLNSEEVVG